jgi:C4-type Zn-finger protein
MARFDHAEFENRLRDLGALGSCPACGDQDANRLDPSDFFLESPGGGRVSVNVAICPTCGYMRVFTPEVLKAEERG